MNASPYQRPNANYLKISTNTTPKPISQNPEMKAAEGGSAVDIMKAMLKERQRRQEDDLVNYIKRILRIHKNRSALQTSLACKFKSFGHD